MPAIKSLGYIQFTTHTVQVSHDLDLDHYVCFKSNDSRCDIDTFNSLEEAVDYILEPLPSLVYTVELGESPEEDSTN
jgi:hypothetical protein